MFCEYLVITFINPGPLIFQNNPWYHIKHFDLSWFNCQTMWPVCSDSRPQGCLGEHTHLCAKRYNPLLKIDVLVKYILLFLFAKDKASQKKDLPKMRLTSNYQLLVLRINQRNGAWVQLTFFIHSFSTKKTKCPRNKSMNNCLLNPRSSQASSLSNQLIKCLHQSSVLLLRLLKCLLIQIYNSSKKSGHVKTLGVIQSQK